MGINGKFKKFIRGNFGNCWKTEDHILNQIHLPIIIIDGTYKLKSCPKGTKNGKEFYRNSFIPEIRKYYNNGAKLIYFCFDRGSPPNKQIEHEKRKKSKKNIIPMPTPKNDDELIISDKKFPENFPSFIANRNLQGDLVYYLTQKIIEDQGGVLSSDKDLIFGWKGDCTLCIHGGRLEKPNRNFPHLTPPSSKLICIKNKLLKQQQQQQPLNNSDTILLKRADIIRDVTFPLERDDFKRKNILEGETAALFYHTAHINDNQMIVSNDGDVLVMLLLASKDRINPVTGLWRNKIILKLHIPCKRDAEYVDINLLYDKIKNHKIFTTNDAKIVDPVTFFCAIGLLSGNDYVHHYCFGTGCYKPKLEKIRLLSISSDSFSSSSYSSSFSSSSSYTNLAQTSDPSKNTQLLTAGGENAKPLSNFVYEKYFTDTAPCPYPLYTFFKYMKRYENMIKVMENKSFCNTLNDRLYENPKNIEHLYEQIKIPGIFKEPINGGGFFLLSYTKTDDEIFIKFTHDIYVTNYTDSISTKTQKLRNKIKEGQIKGLNTPAIKIVRDHLKTYKIKRNRVLVKRKCRVFARNVEWLMNYFTISYRGTCVFESPLKKYLGLPKNGWRKTNLICKQAKRVSLKPPFK